MITSATPKQEKNMLMDKLRKMADKKLKAQDEIKLFYVTVCICLFYRIEYLDITSLIYSPKR